MCGFFAIPRSVIDNTRGNDVGFTLNQTAKDPELKALYGIRDAQAERVAKQAPAPAPEPAAAMVPAQPQAGVPAVNQCMVNNIQAHEGEIKALGDRGAAAQQANNTPLMMAIAYTIMLIQMAGCNR